MGITVLIADDHAVVRDGLRFLLEAQRDIEVIGDAANGREAVQKALQLHPDVVLMDISMPDMNGIEAARQIHAAAPSIRVIILSMHSTREHIFHALEAGVQGYLLKESAGAEVVKAIRAVYVGHRYLGLEITDKVIEDYIRQRETAQVKSPLDQLSQREREVLQLVVEGWSSAEIAKKLSLSPKTVETYRSRLMRKLGICDLPGLVRFAIQHGLTRLE